MGRDNVRLVTWSAVSILLFLSFLTPFVLFSASFVMVPFVILFMITERKRFIISCVLILLILALIGGPFGFSLIMIALFFLFPAITIGIMYRRNATVPDVIGRAIVVFLIEMVTILLLTSAIGTNAIELFRQYVLDSFATIPDIWKQGLTEDIIDQALNMMMRMIPFYMISVAFYYTVVTHIVGRLLLNRMNVQVPKMKPIKQWMLPRLFVYFYLAALLLDLFSFGTEDSLLVTILWNVIPILTVAFVIQAISFLFYVADAKGWGKALPVAGIVFSFFMPGIVSMLGVFDVAFKIREHIRKP